MKKKKKVNKKKFLKRIFFLIILLILIITVTKNIGKKENKEYAINVVVNNKDVTADLLNIPYIDKDNVLYLSIDDVKLLFDKNIYYEKETKKIITTSETKVAAIDVQNNILELNSANLILSVGALDYDENSYIPISELKNIYNIESFTTNNSAVIESLYNELITIKTTKKTSVKEKTSGFSSTVQKIGTGEELIYIEETDKKGWIKVLTYEGNIRIYKK